MVSDGKPTISFRGKRILSAVVSEYIAAAEPVGSRTLASRCDINLSPASIRNVLADLEEAGYLAQPHPSAGRIPTEAGFRAFVNALSNPTALPNADRNTIVTTLEQLRPSLQHVMRETGRMLSALTGAVAVIAAPRAESDPLAQLRFVPLRADAFLAVIITRSGSAENRVVECREAIDPADIERLHNYLAPLVEGRTLLEVRDALAKEMAGEQLELERLRRCAYALVGATVAESAEPPQVIIEGQKHLFDWPELTDIDKLRSYLRALDEKQKLLNLLDLTLQADGVQVFIGSEAMLAEIDDIGVISANYHTNGESTGALGIVGPTRMDYAKLMPIVGFTAQVVSAFLARSGNARREAEDGP